MTRGDGFGHPPIYMKLTKIDTTWLASIAKAFNKAKFNDLSGVEVLELTVAINKLTKLHNDLIDESKSPPPAPIAPQSNEKVTPISKGKKK